MSQRGAWECPQLSAFHVHGEEEGSGHKGFANSLPFAQLLTSYKTARKSLARKSLDLWFLIFKKKEEGKMR